jgi:hypothetical protein
MILILFNWVYILFTAYSLGFLFKKFVGRRFKYEIKSADSIVFAGLVMATVYAQFFSLVYKVGLVANIFLVVVSVVIFTIYCKEIIYNVKNTGIGRKVITLFLILVWCYCTSRGYIHYDSDLYHAQSIRWIEEYGIVKGLGNIHVRFAYNSSFFALQALYSMKFLCGTSLHAVNGFIALLLSFEVVRLIDISNKRRVNISDFARMGAFYYLTVIYSDIVSPATDYTIMCIVFYLVIKWLELLEQNEESYVPYSLICVACVYAVTVKLTAGVILILLIKPAYMLIKDRKWGDIICFILMGTITIAPWVIRTIVISGYLIYPFPAIDIFDVDWKMPLEKAANDAAEIKAWGRGLYNVELVDLKINEWFSNWFRETLPAIGKIFVTLDIICIALYVVIGVINIRKKLKLWNELLVLGAVIASYIFWQTSAPLLRYGYAYVILTIVITFGIIWENLCGKNSKNVVIYTRVVVAVLIALTLIKAVSFAKYVYGNIKQPYYAHQKDYGEYSLASYEVNGVTFYYPIEGDQVGYKYFPAIPVRIDITFRGDDISSGFKP